MTDEERKAKRREYNRLYAAKRRANRTEEEKAAVAAYQRQWYEKNHEHALAYSRRWRAENPERQQEAWKNWRAGLTEEQLAELRKRNHEHATAYRKGKPEQFRASMSVCTARARARRRRAEGFHTLQQLADRFAFYGNKCAYCGADEDLQADHVVPLARGGTNWASNLRPACRSCNASKNDKLLSEWRAA